MPRISKDARARLVISHISFNKKPRPLFFADEALFFTGSVSWGWAYLNLQVKINL
jgi:hypothetical protein